MLQVGIARELINPRRGISLVGYFNPRYNSGILDNISVKAILFGEGKEVNGIVSFDLCFINAKLVEDIKKALIRAGLNFGNKLLFCATHTHSAPAFTDFLGMKSDKDYYKALVSKTVLCIKAAYANMTDSEISWTAIPENPFAFNRRYYMKNGQVLTNPGKLNPDIVKPEGPIDNEIGAVSIEQDGRTVALIATVSNHNDTIGGNLVSAEWPGFMEKRISEHFGYEVNVITLIAPAGNINHFDVTSNSVQTCYDETRRIGNGYAEIIIKNLNKLKRFSGKGKLKSSTTKIDVPSRVISCESYIAARKIIKAFNTDLRVPSF